MFTIYIDNYHHLVQQMSGYEEDIDRSSEDELTAESSYYTRHRQYQDNISTHSEREDFQANIDYDASNNHNNKIFIISSPSPDFRRWLQSGKLRGGGKQRRQVGTNANKKDRVRKRTGGNNKKKKQKVVHMPPVSKTKFKRMQATKKKIQRKISLAKLKSGQNDDSDFDDSQSIQEDPTSDMESETTSKPRSSQYSQSMSPRSSQFSQSMSPPSKTKKKLRRRVDTDSDDEESEEEHQDDRDNHNRGNNNRDRDNHNRGNNKRSNSKSQHSTDHEEEEYEDESEDEQGSQSRTEHEEEQYEDESEDEQGSQSAVDQDQYVDQEEHDNDEGNVSIDELLESYDQDTAQSVSSASSEVFIIDDVDKQQFCMFSNYIYTYPNTFCFYYV